MKIDLNNFIYQCFIFILAFLYASFLANYPFDSHISQDIDAYVKYVLNSKNLYFSYYYEGGLLKLLSNEILFLALNIFLNNFYEPEKVIKTIIFLSSFVTSLLILKYNSKYFILSLLFLIFPAVLFKFIVHLRQGFAISIFLLGWFSSSKSWRWFFFILTPFIHSSFFFVLIVYIVNQFLKKLNFGIGLKTISIIILGIIISLSLEYIIYLTEARQTRYGFQMINVSGLGFLAWLSFFALYLLEGKYFIKKYSFELLIIVFYLTTYFLIGISARVFESAILVVLMAGLSLTVWRKQIFTILFTLYLIAAMYLRLF
jgi:hypothetical protein